MKSDAEWKAAAELLRAATKNKQPPLKIQEVMRVLGYASENTAQYALYKMKELGLVFWAKNGNKKGQWFLK